MCLQNTNRKKKQPIFTKVYLNQMESSTFLQQFWTWNLYWIQHIYTYNGTQVFSKLFLQKVFLFFKVSLQNTDRKNSQIEKILMQ